MTIDRPILCRWTGDAFVPANKYWHNQAMSSFEKEEITALMRHEERSIASHRAYFAMLRSAWMNIPEKLCAEYPTETHLRKKALIACGFADERSIVCSSKAEALRVSAFIKPMDEYAVVLTSGPVVKVFTAQSQSVKAMGKAEFQRSKTAVLDYVAGLLSVSPKQLEGRAA